MTRTRTQQGPEGERVVESVLMDLCVCKCVCDMTLCSYTNTHTFQQPSSQRAGYTERKFFYSIVVTQYTSTNTHTHVSSSTTQTHRLEGNRVGANSSLLRSLMHCAPHLSFGVDAGPALVNPAQMLASLLPIVSLRDNPSGIFLLSITYTY